MLYEIIRDEICFVVSLRASSLMQLAEKYGDCLRSHLCSEQEAFSERRGWKNTAPGERI